MGLFLNENSPRPWSLVYAEDRARAVLRHQAEWLTPRATALVYAGASAAYVAIPAGYGLAGTASLVLGPALVAGWGAHALWRWTSARLYAALDAHPIPQARIAAGYRMPLRPEDDSPLLVLGEVHPAREYSSRGSYDLAYTTTDSYSPAPEWFVIPTRGLTTGTLILGATGSGKTAFILRPAAFRLFAHSSRPGGLTLESKSALVSPLRSELAACGREDDLLLIGPGRPTRWNPLHAPEATPAAIAERILSAVENLNGARYDAASRWIRRGAVLLAEGAIGALRLRSGYVTPLALRVLLSELTAVTQAADAPAESAAELIEALYAGTSLNPRETAEYNHYLGLITSWASEDEKFRTIYVSELFGLIIPLTAPNVVEQYSAPLDALDMPSWPEAINRGLILCLDCNSAAVPGLAVILGTLLKLGFQDAILARIDYVRKGICNADRYMCLIIDEFQDFVSPNDHLYLAKSRESRAITILATQGWPSIVDKIGEDAAKVLIQNLRNKIILTQENPDPAADMLGQADFIDTTKSVNENVQDAALSAAGRFAGNSTVSESISQTRNRRHIVPPELLANLPTGHAIIRATDGDNQLPVTRVYLRPYFAYDVRHFDFCRIKNE